MHEPSTRNERIFESAHILSEALISGGPYDGPVLEVAAGKGRNTRALVAAGLDVRTTADEHPYTQLPFADATFAAALSTHGYLHGTVAKLRAGLAELRRVLRPGAIAYITLGSIEDERFGLGLALDDNTFAPGEGDEQGIPHAYFDRDGVVELLRGFEIRSLEHVDAAAHVGRWAHADPSGIRHWFVTAART
jgi:SAM-dependent methyltransferase